MIQHYSTLLPTLTILLTSTNSTTAWPKLEIESREYKVILSTIPFQGNETSISTTLHHLQNDLISIASKVGVKPYGEFQTKLGTPRHVRYYDGSDCKLKAGGYVLSLRREIKEKDESEEEAEGEKEAWEGTLKARSGDRYYTTYKSRNMDSCCKSCVDLGGKLEEDLTIHWDSLYSYSQRCQINDETQFNTLGDIAHHWKDMESVMVDELKWDMEDSLQIVGGLTVIEHVYDGFFINFDDGDKDDLGKFTVTIWYDEVDEYFLVEPILVELSFRIKSTGKKLEDWREGTILKAHEFWEECGKSNGGGGLLREWIDFGEGMTTTKTERVYGYDMGWCLEEEDQMSDADR